MTRIVLALAVDRDDDVTAVVADRRHPCSGLAVIARQMEHANPQAALRDVVESGCIPPCGAAVIASMSAHTAWRQTRR